jgi:hypothetical protein
LFDAREGETRAAAFAEQAANAAPSDEDKHMAYSAAGIGVMAFSRRVDFTALGFSIPRLREGAVLLYKRFPKSTLHEQFTCLLACLERDRAAALPLFERIGSRPNFTVWVPDEYERMRRTITAMEDDEAKLVIDTGIHPIASMSASSDGTKLLVSRQAAVSALELYSGNWQAKPEVLPVDGEVTAAALNPRGDMFAVALKNDDDFRFELWDLAKRERKQWRELPERCNQCAFAPNG